MSNGLIISEHNFCNLVKLPVNAGQQIHPPRLLQEFINDLRDPAKIQCVWEEMVNAPSLQRQAAYTLRDLMLAGAQAALGDYNLQSDELNLVGLARDFVESAMNSKSMAGTAEPIPTSQILAGINFGAEETHEAINTESISAYTPPSFNAIIKALKSAFKKGQTVRGKLEAWVTSDVLLTLYKNDPTIPEKQEDGPAYRQWCATVLRPFFDCFKVCCSESIEDMVGKYEGYKVNETNWKTAKGCVCKKGPEWEKWKRL